MPTVTINTGHINDDNNQILTLIDVMPPFKAGIGISSGELVVGTDFTSGDTLVFAIPGTTKIRFATFTNNKGAILAYTEANTTAPVGKTLTLDSAVTTNVKFFIEFDT